MAESNPTQVILTDDGIKIIKAQSAADKAVGLAGTNATGIKNINDPNYLSPFEKPQLEIQMDNFATIYAADKDIATSEGIDFTAYEAAYQAYVAYMTPLIADMTTYSPIVRSTFNSMVTAVQAEQKRFNAATQAQYSQQINKAKTDIANGQTKYEALQSEAKIMESSAAGIADKANRLASQYDDTNSLASQALEKASSAQIDASSAVSKAESAASAFGKVDQKADSAFSNAMSAESAASSAVSQASSAAADSKDAKQIAGAVSQSYKTLTDGSTMTIAELQNGLAVKLTKKDLDGYATQDWAQNQIAVTADGINSTMSSIKSTVDGHTTSINEIQADSKEFKSQFTTVNDTIGKHTTDISTLQVSSKELTTGFNTLTTDNGTNKNDISQLKQTATEVTSTLETVQTQVQDSAVGTNLLTNTGDLSANWLLNGTVDTSQKPAVLHYPTTMLTEGANFIANQQFNDGLLKPSTTYTASFYAKGEGAITFYCYPGVAKDREDTYTLIKITNEYKLYAITFTTLPTISGNKNFLLRQDYIPSDTDQNTVEAYIYGIKLEKGSVATDWCPNPEDNATVTAVSKLSQTVDGMQTDISKKIEQKDLNGYATQDWSNNQIKITADGINGAISSVKNTVDSQTTSIHDLQTDSNGFKDQFTKVNNTIGQHTTDIGKLQHDAQSLSSNFDSLDGDNKTNQHNIGELQQSSKDFSSTLIKVKDSLSTIGTPNLVSAYNWRTEPDDGGSPMTTTTHPFYNGLRPLYLINNQTSNENYAYSPRFNLKPNTTYVVSLIGFEDVHVSSSDVFILARNAGETASSTIAYNPIPGVVFSSTKAQYVASSAFTTGNDVDSGFIRIDNNGSKDGNNGGLFFTEVKLQEGTIATPYTSAQEDLATVTAVSSISQTIDKIQGTIIDKADQSQITQLADQITTTVGQISGVNLIPNSDFSQDSQYWNLSDKASIVAHGWKYTDGALVLDPSDTVKDTFIDIGVSPNTDYTFSCNMYGTSHIFLVPMKGTTGDWVPVDDDYQDNFHTLTGTDESTPRQSFTLKRTSGQTRRLRLILRAEAGTTRSVFTKFQLEEGNIAHAWGPSNIGLATFSQITQLKDDIDLRVKKGDVVNQLNIDAGGALLQTVGDSTKIVFSSSNIIFDSNNPVQIPNANIPGTLTGKTIEAAKITGTTKITGADIEAPIIHSPSGSFKLDGNTGDIIGASIHSANNSWGISKDGVINGSTINGSTINGTTFHGGDIINDANNTAKYYPMTITPDGAYKSTYFDSAVGLQSSVESGAINYKYRSMIGNGQYLAYDSIINGQGFESHSGYTSVKDATFSNTETITGYVNVTPDSGIYLYGPTQKINFAGRAGDIGSNGSTMDAYGNLFGQANSWYWRIGDANSNAVADFGFDAPNQRNILLYRNTQVGNLFLGVGHTIGMLDSSPLYFKKGDSNGTMLGLYAGAIHYENLIKSSLLSVKRDVKKVDTAYWAQLVNSIDLATYQYKTDDNTSHIRLSSIVDDVNDTKQWQLPDVFVSRDEDGKLCGVDDSVLLNATLATVQEQQKEIDQLNGHNMELEARLNKLEAKLNG
ncbi:protein of unknown function [Lactiplantibacillus plantarum]|uniref:hypothetical protein n=1 Tax=Lactiplantibacillus plantarum TaxID=1590 RepID=UPI0021A9FBF6|nr:hypothetical protein [Lactiplantibacillus plantarum]